MPTSDHMKYNMKYKPDDKGKNYEKGLARFAAIDEI